MQLDPIRLNGWQALRELRPHQDAILGRFDTGQGDDLKYRRVDVQRYPPLRRLLDQRPDPPDDIARS